MIRFFGCSIAGSILAVLLVWLTHLQAGPVVGLLIGTGGALLGMCVGAWWDLWHLGRRYG